MIGYAVLFKDKEARITIVKKKKEDKDALETAIEETFNPDKIALVEETGKRWVKYLATTAVLTVAAIKVIDVLGDIAVKKTKSADNED